MDKPDSAKPPFMRKSLIERYVFSFGNELKHRQGAKVYDDKYVERLGNFEEVLEEKWSKLLWKMLLVDFVIFLFSTGKKFEIKVTGVEISDLPAITEVLLIISSLMYFAQVIAFIDKEIYARLISQWLKERNPNLDPCFFHAALAPQSFTLDLLSPRRYGLQSGVMHKGVVFVIYAVGFLIIFALYAFHFYVAREGGIYVESNSFFGTDAGSVIRWATWSVNLVGLITFLTAYFFSYKFTIDDRGESEKKSS